LNVEPSTISDIFPFRDWRHVGAKGKAKRGFFAAGLSLTSASSQIMSRLVWEYEGANEEKHGEQCVFVGDKVHHDSHGEGIAVRMDGAMIIIEFVEDGERIEKHQTKGRVYALEQRERAQQKRTGRRPEGQLGLLASLFGKEHEAPVGAEVAQKRQRHGPFAGPKAPKATAVTPTATPNAAASPATAAAAAQPATATPSPAVTHQQLPGIALLGLQYASDEDEAEGGTPAAGALAGAKHRQPIGFCALTAEKKSEVRHTQYEARKVNKQEDWFKTYRAWLVKSEDKGAHCKFCIVSLTKPKDKLSTTGYGWTGQGEERLLNPIPTVQKLIQHENSPMHRLNVTNAEKMAAGAVGALTRTTGSQPVYLTITPEDELYARTIRTVHLIVVRQLSLNDMYSRSRRSR
jgi:hypothetical protein